MITFLSIWKSKYKISIKAQSITKTDVIHIIMHMYLHKAMILTM